MTLLENYIKTRSVFIKYCILTQLRTAILANMPKPPGRSASEPLACFNAANRGSLIAAFT